MDFDLYATLGAGAYICGEETALIESLEGKKGLPRFKPPFPAQYGVYGQPTTINNTETFASVPSIIRNGGDWFMALGRPNNGGVKCFSVSGHVNRPGNFEVPLGTPFRDLLALAGGVRGGRRLKAVIPGGSSVPPLPGDVMMDVDMDYDSIQKAGSLLGSGAVVVMDETTSMVSMLRRIARFYYAESCGQCTPCREGTGWLYRVLCRIERGEARQEELDMLVDVADNIEGRTILCLGRRRGLAGAGLPAPFPRRVPVPRRSRDLPAGGGGCEGGGVISKKEPAIAGRRTSRCLCASIWRHGATAWAGVRRCGADGPMVFVRHIASSPNR